MKTLSTKLILLFSLLIITFGCEDENYTESKLYKTQTIKDEFTLEDFDDVFVKNNLEVKWNDYEASLDSITGKETFEFNTDLKVKSTINDYVVYKLIASKNTLDDWEFELIKFSGGNTKLSNTLSFLSINSYSGSIYFYNLTGKNTKIEVYETGKLKDEVSFKYGNDAKYIAQEPDGGAWALMIVDHLRDWYSNTEGGSTLFYTHTTYHGSSYEWVRTGGDSYNGMPYDTGTSSYHNHYPGGGSSGGYPVNYDPHHEEEILEQIDDSNLNDCHSNLVEILKNLENGIVGEMIQKLAGTNSTSYNWRLDYDMPKGSNPDATASTDPVATSNSITTHINRNRVNNSTDLSMARTLTHEAIHAFLAYQYRYDYSTNNLNYTTLLDNYADEFNSNANDTHHILFLKENLIDPISSTLQEYGENLGYNLPYQYYRDMAYGGLYNTSATNNVFENLVPNQSDTDRIKNRISAETDNQNVNGVKPQGEKACN